jgi:hypothetical protein
MQYTVDLDAGYGIAGQTAQKYSAQRVTQSDTEASLQRIYDKLAACSIFTEVNRRNIGLFDLNHSK